MTRVLRRFRRVLRTRQAAFARAAFA